MESRTFEELSQHFKEKLSGLVESLAIQSCMESTEEEEEGEKGRQSMQSLWQEVDDLSAVLTLIKSKCSDQRKILTGVEVVKQKLMAFMKEVQYTNNNIPPHLPKVATVASEHQSPATGRAAELKAQAPPGPGPVPVTRQGDGDPPGLQANAASNVVHKKRPPCPLIEYLTVDEFEDIPKYMKGRLTYQQVNKVIDELNKVYMAKYKLMRQKKSTINDANRKRWETMKMQETKETKNVYFIVESDIKEWSALKMSKETQSFFPLLRHCGRLFEIRGGGHLRYAMVEMY